MESMKSLDSFENPKKTFSLEKTVDKHFIMMKFVGSQLGYQHPQKHFKQLFQPI